MNEINFKVKPEKIWHGDVARFRVKVPEIGRRHCNMDAFRKSRRFGSYANSDIFPAMLARGLKQEGVPSHWYDGDALPPCVSVDNSGFLWAVKIILPESL